MSSTSFLFLLLGSIFLPFSLGQTTVGSKVEVDETEAGSGTGSSSSSQVVVTAKQPPSDSNGRIQINNEELEQITTTTVDPVVNETEAKTGPQNKNVTIPDYFAKEPPPHDPNVHLRIFIDELKLNETELTCNVSIWLTLEWTDNRLLEWFQGNPLFPSERGRRMNTSQIWKPVVAVSYNTGVYIKTDPSFSFENQAYLNLLSEQDDPGRLRLYLNETKSVVVPSKEKTFQYFPGDTHSCELNLTFSTVQGTTGYFHMSTNFWKAADDDDLFAISYQTREFKTHASQSRGWVPKSSSISSNTFGIRIVFARKHGYSLIQTYLPSVFFLLVGLLSLLLPVDIASDRVAICTGILLTLTIFLNTARMEGPSVSYLRALDYWLVGCIGFVFMTLFLNIVILRMTAKKTVKTRKAIQNIVSANASLVLRLGGTPAAGAATESGSEIAEEGRTQVETEKDPLRYARRLNT